MLLVPIGVACCGGRVGDLGFAGRLTGSDFIVALSPPLSLSLWPAGTGCQRRQGGRWSRAALRHRAGPVAELELGFFVLFLFFS
jgi:hypothetical protein